MSFAISLRSSSSTNHSFHTDVDSNASGWSLGPAGLGGSPAAAAASAAASSAAFAAFAAAAFCGSTVSSLSHSK